MTFRRIGNLDINGIKRVLGREDSARDYAMVRSRIQAQEPVLWNNLQHWIKVESAEFKKRSPETDQRATALLEILLERYFVRGFCMHTELINEDLRSSLEG